MAKIKKPHAGRFGSGVKPHAGRFGSGVKPHAGRVGSGVKPLAGRQREREEQARISSRSFNKKKFFF